MIELLKNINFPILPIVVGFCVFVYIKIKRSSVSVKKNELIKREQEALFSRKHDISENLFINVNTSLPFGEIKLNDNIIKSIKRLKEEIETLQLSHIIKPNLNVSNLELKETYGVENLELFIKYEKNYNRYIIKLNEISNILIKEKQYNTAEKFLLEAKRIDSDLSKTYIYLIDIYKNTNKAKLDELIEEFKKEHEDSNSYYVNKVIEYYDNIIKR